MANVTGSFLQGILVPDPRITADTYDPALSTVTQAGPRAGVPVDQGASLLTLGASGDQVADTSLTVGVVRAGTPPRMRWRETGDALWRGWEPPLALQGRAFLHYATTSTPGDAHPHVVTLASGVVLAAHDYSPVAGQHTTGVFRLDADDDAPAWSARVTVYSHGQTSTYGSWPSIVQLASGRVLAYYWVESLDSGVTTAARIQMSYSDDDGATWTVGAASVLGALQTVAASAFQPGRIRVARSGDQMCMVVGYRSTSTYYWDRLRQYASIDDGATWVQVADYDGGIDGTDAHTTQQGGYHDLVTDGGTGFVLVYIQMPVGVDDYMARARHLGSATHPITAGDPVAVTITNDNTSAPVVWATGVQDDVTDPDNPGGYLVTGDLALVRDEDGTIYIYGRDADDAEVGVALVTTDAGTTWEPHASSVGGYGWQPWHYGDAAAYPRGYAAAMCRGRAVMVGQHAANPGTGDYSLSAMYLGGYTTCPMGSVDGGVGGSALNRTAWILAWQPYDLPQNTGAEWTLATTGAPTTPAFDGSGAMTTTTGAAQTIYYSATPAASGIDGAMCVEAEVTVSAGTAEVYARTGDASGLYQVRVAISTTQLILRDVVAGSNLVTVSDTVGASGVQVRIYLNEGATVAYYRALSASHDQHWTLLGAATGLSLNGAASSVDQIKIGVPASSTASWTWFAAGPRSRGGWDTMEDSDDVQALIGGRALIGAPGVYVDQGVSVSASGGPALLADEWVVETAYDYPVTAVDPTVAPSPSREWRSTQTASAEIIAWSWHADGTVSLPPGRALGLYLGGANFRTAYFEGRDVGGSWVTLGTWDAADGQSSLRYTRSGESVYVDTSGSSSSPWYPTDALAGSCFQSDSSTSRRILAQSAGTWTASTTQTPVLRLAGVAGGDPASGTSGKILARNGLLLVPSTGTGYSAFRVRIPGGQPTPDGYYRLGVAMMGLLHVWGQEYSWGRRIDLAPNVLVTTGRTGERTATRLGPPRRAVDIAWPDGIDTTKVGGSAPTPDYVQARTGGAAVATPAGTPWDLVGVVSRLDRAPVVYFDGLPITSGSERMIAHPTRIMYGRVVSDVAIEQVIGREWGDTAGEVMRIATVRIEEEV